MKRQNTYHSNLTKSRDERGENRELFISKFVMPTLYLRKNSEKGVAQNPLTIRVYPLNCIGWVKYDLHNKTAIKHDKFVFFFYLFSQMLREMTKKMRAFVVCR